MQVTKEANPNRDFRLRRRHVTFYCGVCDAEACPIRIDHFRLLENEKFGFSTPDVGKLVDRLILEWSTKTINFDKAILACLKTDRDDVLGHLRVTTQQR
jgi:hypothetical protein